MLDVHAVSTTVRRLARRNSLATLCTVQQPDRSTRVYYVMKDTSNWENVQWNLHIGIILGLETSLPE